MLPRRLLLVGALSLFAATAAPAVRAQCLLANPSFELPGTGGQVFGGWNQFGQIGTSTAATHGDTAARVSGPNNGNWDVSGYWQRLDSAPGDRWSASVSVAHSPLKPLLGQCKAILNIEWRAGNGTLISYESHTLADATTPVGEANVVTVTSQPAPAGTAAIHFLLGVLQSPADPQPDVYYDQATCDELGPPTLEQQQWNDFPGGRTLAFSGRTWRVKGPGFFGPGPNLFCDTANCTWVDAQGRLHLTVKNQSGSWYSTEVVLQDVLGYGDYQFTTVGPIHAFDPTVVFGLFIWQYGACYDPAYGWWNPYNEIDVEWSRWGNAANGPAQFVAQPFDYPGNIERFSATIGATERTTHAFRWLADRVEFRSWRGGPDDELPTNLIHAWTYTGPHIPRPEIPRVHLNLWQFSGPPSTNQEAIVESFFFEPADPPADAAEDPLPASVRTRFCSVEPNPSSGPVKIHFQLPVGGMAELAIFDVAGRRIRRLESGPRSAGEHTLVWDGRDEAGVEVEAGVYLYRYRAGNTVESDRIVIAR